MPTYLKQPSAWYRRLINQRRQSQEGITRAIENGNEIAQKIYEREVTEIDKEIELEKAYLRDSIKLVRRFASGFEARDGFDLHRVATLHPSREEKVRRYAAQIRQELASPHIEIVPRTRVAYKEVERHTGQTTIPGRKRFVVHVNKPETTSFKIIYKTVIVKNARGRRKKQKTAHIEISQQVKGGAVQDRYFYFPQKPKSFEHIIKMTRQLLKSMPKGYYALQSSNHGTIGRSIPSELLLEELHDRYLGYDRFFPGNDDQGLAPTLTGYKLISFTAKGEAREYKERLATRLQLQKLRRADRAKHRAEVLAKKGLYTCPKCGRVLHGKQRLAQHMKIHR